MSSCLSPTGVALSPTALLDEAELCLAFGAHQAAACLVRAALEVRLQAVCDSLGCVFYVRQGVPNCPRASRYLKSIRRRKIVAKPEANALERILADTSRAAHGRPIAREKVARFLDVVSSFIAATAGRVGA